jgi:hypothetical protein
MGDYNGVDSILRRRGCQVTTLGLSLAHACTGKGACLEAAMHQSTAVGKKRLPTISLDCRYSQDTTFIFKSKNTDTRSIERIYSIVRVSACTDRVYKRTVGCE